MNRNINHRLLFKTTFLLTAAILLPMLICANVFGWNLDDAQAISRFTERVHRNGIFLYLRLKNNDQLVLMDVEHPYADGVTLYGFEYYDKDAGYFHINVNYYEGGETLLINEVSGNQYFLHEDPITSPRGKRITVVSNAWYGTRGIFIWRLTQEGLVEEFQDEVSEQFIPYSFIEWKGDSAIHLVKTVDADRALCPASEYMSFPVTLSLSNGKWQYHERRENPDCTAIAPAYR